MCAAALSVLRPKRVVFGCHNPRFGGVGSVLDVVKGKFPGCGLRHAEIGEEEEKRENGDRGGEAEAGEEEEEEAGGVEEEGGGGSERIDLGSEEAGKDAPRVEPPFSTGKTEARSTSTSTPSLPPLLLKNSPACPYETLGGVLSAEAVALLKEFYETGNPSAPRPNRPEAAAATRAARKQRAAEAEAEAAAAAAASASVVPALAAAAKMKSGM